MGSVWGRKTDGVFKRLSKYQLWDVSKKYEHTMKFFKTEQHCEGAPVQTCKEAVFSGIIFLSMTESYFSKLKRKKPLRCFLETPTDDNIFTELLTKIIT